MLRTLIIINALVLHFGEKIPLGSFYVPFLIFQNRIVTVGGIFFFCAGYMARKVYYDKFVVNQMLYAKTIFLKGLKILIIYLVYILLMHLFTATDIPKNLLFFIFGHRFFAKVLFIFSLLYMITPLFLYLAYNHKKQLLVYLFLITFIMLIYNSHWPVPLSIKVILLDRTLSLYPLLPSLVIYAVGYGIAHVETSYNIKIPSYIIILIIVTLIVHLILSLNVQPYEEFVLTKKYFTLIELVTPYMLLLVIRRITSNNSIYRILSNQNFLCIGIFSLHFYLTSNLLLSLVRISEETCMIIKFIVLAGIFILSYMYTHMKYFSMRVGEASRNITY